MVPRPIVENENFIANGVRIDKVYDFKYLGFTLTSDNKQKVHIDKRIILANLSKQNLTKMGLKNVNWMPQ